MNIFLCRTVLFIVASLVLPLAMASEGDVCSLKKNGERSVGVTVSFRGNILSDGMHSTLIYPEKCPGTGILIARNDTENSSVEIIRQSIMKVGSPGTTDKKITVEVDARVTVIGGHRTALKITRLKHLVLTYPGD